MRKVWSSTWDCGRCECWRCHRWWGSPQSWGALRSEWKSTCDRSVEWPHTAPEGCTGRRDSNRGWKLGRILLCNYETFKNNVILQKSVTCGIIIIIIIIIVIKYSKEKLKNSRWTADKNERTGLLRVSTWIQVCNQTFCAQQAIIICSILFPVNHVWGGTG